MTAAPIGRRPTRSPPMPATIPAASTSSRTIRIWSTGRPIGPPLFAGRHDLRDLQGLARRRRLPLRVDEPAAPRPHRPRQRPGRGDQRRRRQDLDQLVQPADRPVLSPGDRQPLPLLDLLGPAGFRHRGIASRSDYGRSPSATGTRSAAKSATTTFPTRSIPDRLRLRPRRPRHPLGRAHGPGRERLAMAGLELWQAAHDCEIPLQLGHPAGDLAHRPRHPLPRRPAALRLAPTGASTGA